MPIQVYCSNCGSKNIGEITKPKFCSNCGEPIDKAFKTPTKPIIKNIEEPEDPFVEIAQGSLNDFEIIVNRKITLGDLSKIENPINTKNRGGGVGLPSDIEIKSKNFFSDLDNNLK